MDGAKERRNEERQSDGVTDRQSNGATERRSNRTIEQRSGGVTKQIFREYLTVSAKSKTLGTMCRDFLMPLVSGILAN